MKKRVVITGLGAITPVGNTAADFWQALLAGKSGIGPITRFDAAEYDAKIAGEVKGFEPTAFIDKKEARRMDRFTQFAIAAAKMALDDSGIDLEKADKSRIGSFVGSGIGGMDTLHEQYKNLFEKGPNRVSPFFIPMMIANMASGQVSIHFELMGPVLTDVTACASGNNAIGLSLRMIQYGDADVMFAGGTEAAVTKAPMAGFAAIQFLFCILHLFVIIIERKIVEKVIK